MRTLWDLLRQIPRILPLPAAAWIGFVLLTSPKVWTTRTLGRSGQPGATFGSLGLGAAIALTIGYYAVPKLMELFPAVRGGWGMKTPSEGELSVAAVLVRGMIACVLYVVAWVLWSRFGAPADRV